MTSRIGKATPSTNLRSLQRGRYTPCGSLIERPIQRALNQLTASEMIMWRRRGRNKTLAAIIKAKELVSALR